MHLRVAFIPFSTEPKSPRSFRAEIFYLPERLSRARRVILRGRLRRNSTGKGGPVLSLFSAHLNLDPNSGVRTAGPCESVAGSLATIRTLRVRVRFFSPIQRAADRSPALCRGCPSRAAKIRSLSTKGRDLSG